MKTFYHRCFFLQLKLVAPSPQGAKLFPPIIVKLPTFAQTQNTNNNKLKKSQPMFSITWTLKHDEPAAYQLKW